MPSFVGLDILGLATQTVKIVSAAIVIGNNDVYTVPAGYKAVIVQGVFNNNTAGVFAHYLAVKRSSVYTRISANSNTVANQPSAFSLAYTFVFLPGDIIAVNSAAVAGRVHFKIALIPDNVPINSYLVTTVSSSDTVLYTVPPGKRAKIIAYSASNLNNTNYGNVFIGNLTGGGVTFNLSYIPNGQTKDSTHLILSITIGTGTVGAPNIVDLMEAGDSLVMSTSPTNPGSWWLLTVIEF